MLTHPRPAFAIFTSVRASLALVPGLLSASCASHPGSRPDAAPPVVAERPVAIVDGHAVTWTNLEPALAETAGGQVLEEWVLDHRIEEMAADRHVTITDADIDHERDLLVDNLAHAGLTPDETTEMVQRLRRQRGLGDLRFAALLRRNAVLRALVRDEVKITPDILQRAFEVANGPRVRVRLIVTLRLADAAAARDAVLVGGKPDRTRFVDTAVRVSTDESGARGGLIEAFSPDDLAYPAALRQTIAGMKPGELSPVIALDRGYAVVYVEAALPPTGKTLEQTRGELEKNLRLRQERLLMDQLARECITRPGVTVIDRSLSWSWANNEPAKATPDAPK